MGKKFYNSFLACALITILFCVSCSRQDHPNTAGKKIDLKFYGLTASHELVKYNAKSPEYVLAKKAISGLEGGVRLLAIDFRPATGQLYAIGNNSRLYVINPETGAARVIGASAFTPAIQGTIAGFDFNPTVDRIRLVTNNGQNLRLNPETGMVQVVDGNLNPGTPMVNGAAYTNSFAGAAATSLFDIDLSTQKLVKQNPPNEGKLVEVGSLKIDASGEGGFDISPDSKIDLAALNVGKANNLYQIDTATGKAHKLGTLARPIIALAIPTKAVAYTVGVNNSLLILNPHTSSTPINKPITNLQPGETILGIDIRPATGQLYALGSSSRIYTLNMSSGLATPVSMMPFSPALNGTSFGFDFNPTVDRIRIVSNLGQNLRAHPETGVIAVTDMPLNPAGSMIGSAAYTNNFAGATTTMLYDIDFITDRLFLQNPPNDGTLVGVGTSLGANIEANHGFDIGGQSNKAYVLTTSGGNSKLYAVDLTNGKASLTANFAATSNGLAIGLGF